MEWIKVKKSHFEEITPVVTFRAKAIAFNAPMVKLGNLRNGMSCEIEFTLDQRMIKFNFIDKPSTESEYLFSVVNDGGGNNRTTSSLIVQCQDFIKNNEFIQKISNNSKFKTTKLRHGSSWIVNLSPAFEKTCYSFEQVSSKIKGIYRYIKDKEIVYIGIGDIRSRLKEEARKKWSFDKIEFTEVKEKKEREKWESIFLSEYYNENKKLPLYNKVKGKEIKN